MTPIQVLLVDDDPMVLQVNREYVQATEGFRVVATARNGAEALAVAAAAQPDLILLDVYMPDKDGLAMLRELRSQGIPSDVILVTAAQDAPTIQTALRHGAVDVIIKPFRFHRLRSALEAFRKLKSELGGSPSLSQEQLDRVLRQAPPQAPSDEPPKGLNDLTLRQVLEYLTVPREPCTSAEVAEGLGISRVTARRYLEYLESLGKVRVEPQYGGVGRPQNRYSLR
jgi:two-component system response regulator DctR